MREGVSAGNEATTGTIAASNASGVFNLTSSLTTPFAVVLIDNTACGNNVVITIENDCAKPPVCPEITGSMIDDIDGNICPTDQVCFDITTFSNLPNGGTIDFFYDNNTSFNPYNGEGTYLDPSSSSSTTPNGGNITVTSNAPTGSPVLNEVLYDPAGPDGSNACEAVEIAGTPGTDLSCFMLSDGDFVVTIPDGEVIPDDGFYVMQTKSCSLSQWFSCKKWIKDFFKIFCGDPGTSIGD